MDLIGVYLGRLNLNLIPGQVYRFGYDYSAAGNAGFKIRDFEMTYMHSYYDEFDGLVHAFEDPDNAAPNVFSDKQMFDIEPIKEVNDESARSIL